MEEQERLSLNYFLQLCLQFEDDPTQENDLEIKKFLGALQIKEYLPLQQKTVIGIQIVRDLIDEFDASGSASMLEIDKIFKGLMSYVVNMDVDIAPLDKTFVAYDYCHEYKLVDTILDVCERDFKRFCEYVDGMVNTSNAYRLIQTASVFNDAEYDKWINTMKDLPEKLTPEMLQGLLAIDVMNNGGSEFQNLLGEAALTGINKGASLDEAKYEAIAKDLDKKFNHNYNTILEVVGDQIEEEAENEDEDNEDK